MGIDVSEEKLDVAIGGEKNCLEVTNGQRGMAKLIQQMLDCAPKCIVVEATGGYEEAALQGLFEARLPVALVSPQRVWQYARAKGLLAETDQIDAQVLAD